MRRRSGAEYLVPGTASVGVAHRSAASITHPEIRIIVVSSSTGKSVCVVTAALKPHGSVRASRRLEERLLPAWSLPETMTEYIVFGSRPVMVFE